MVTASSSGAVKAQLWLRVDATQGGLWTHYDLTSERTNHSPCGSVAWLTQDLISIYIEMRSGNHTLIFSYLCRGLRLPGAVYWALQMSIM